MSWSGYHRPAAFAHGGTDELAHHLGHTRVHLGLNMAATAVPVAPEEAGDTAQGGSEDVVLYFGIIDILQVSQAWTDWLNSSVATCTIWSCDGHERYICDDYVCHLMLGLSCTLTRTAWRID